MPQYTAPTSFAQLSTSSSAALHAIDNNLEIPLGSFTDRQIAVTDEDVETDAPLHGSLEDVFLVLTGHGLRD